MMKLKETESIEFKRLLNDSFEKEVVAFLNTNSGRIYLGIDDNGKIIGIENTDQVMKEIVEIITNKILPSSQNLIKYQLKIINGKNIIIVDVEKGNYLY